MIIRRATPADIPAIQALLAQILAVYHQARPDVFKAEGSKFTDEQLAQIIADDSKPVFVCCNDDGTVLAHLFLEIHVAQDSVLQPLKTLFIEDLCVDQHARGGKIGARLHAFATDFAKQNGCYNLTLRVWNDNAGATRFYENLGMKAQYTSMEQIL